ncbi:MAG: T9SS type A sorting domain-containing protein [Gemmatimonadota bacterium]|nr:MAG: T9SS type A sorting domain-containing protein [Gemmatimonadota bacterium]
MKHFKVFSLVVLMLLGVVVGNGSAQFRLSNVSITDATGVPGETLDIVISMNTAGIGVDGSMGSFEFDFSFDTQIFEVTALQVLGPFAGWCAIDYQAGGTGITIAPSEQCDPLDLGTAMRDVLRLSMLVKESAVPGTYELDIPMAPAPVFAPDGTPFDAVSVSSGAFQVKPIKLSLADISAAQGSRRIEVDLYMDIYNPEGVVAFNLDVLYDDAALTVTAVDKTERTSSVPNWQFSVFEGGVTLLAIGQDLGTGALFPIAPGMGSIAKLYIDVSPNAPAGDVAMTFSNVTITKKVDDEDIKLSPKVVHGALEVVSPSAILSLGNGAGHPGGTASAPVNLYQTTDVASVQFDVLFNTNVLSVTGVTSPGGGCAFNTANITGGVTITGTCSLLPGAGPIADIQFNVVGTSSGEYPLALSNVTLTDGVGGAVPTGMEEGQINVVSSGTAVVTVGGSAAMIGATGNTVAVNLANDVDVSAFQMDLGFDTQYMSVQDVTSTTRSAGMDSLTWNNLNGGIRILFYSVGGGVIGAADGSILNITFDVDRGTPGGFYDFSISGVVVGDADRNRVNVESFDGTLWITCGTQGDINSDYDFDIADVVTLVNIILEGIDYDGCTLQKGDYNEDDMLNILDVVAMVDDILSGMTKSVAPYGTATVWADQVTASETQEFELPIRIETQAEIVGAQLTLRYNPNALEPSTPNLMKSSQHMSLASRAHNGELTIVVYSLDGRALNGGENGVVTVPFRRTSGSLDLDFGEVILAGHQGQSIAAEVRPISLKSGLLPEEFALNQNYPNPFNPETKIAFSLPSDSRVALSVYNVLGQRVATLINTEMSAGQHSVTWMADSVPTGVYFYTITAGEFTATKKMILLK